MNIKEKPQLEAAAQEEKYSSNLANSQTF